MHSSLHLVVHM
ncbi:hypothetical protein F383_02196 [Gossypium arboreum]|uniref:Uncharacterized protein n=1 Tax=Gossypium arboreum TaxID=29729 RepID=A0A0B0PFC8_GOSAR|nr:hypothetical protein F383_02196 [Gossypium arboreum]